MSLAPPPRRQRGSQLGRVLATFLESRLGATALVCVALLCLTAAIGPFFAPQDPFDLATLDYLDSVLPPGSPASNGSVYLLGTDDQGRDMLSAMTYGLRTSLFVGLFSAMLASAVGVSIGLMAAYVGGWVDALLMRLVDLQLAFPSILVALIIVAFLGKGVGSVMLALIIVEWAYYARTARATTLVERRREYIEAAECLRLPQWRILAGHLLPNCLPPLIIVATQQIARAIAIEATLSFLGLGVPVTEPSLGLLIANGYPYLLSGKNWISFYPGALLLVTILAISLVGDRLRDALDPRAM